MAQKRKRSQGAPAKKPAPSTRKGTQSKLPKQPVRADKEKKKTVKNTTPPTTAQNQSRVTNARSSGENRFVLVDPVRVTTFRNDSPTAIAQDPSAKQVSNARSCPESRPVLETVVECECSICLDTSGHTRMKYLPCFHKFHQFCINTWLDLHRICPICRTYVERAIAPLNYQYRPVAKF